jgi:hypothetical protein
VDDRAAHDTQPRLVVTNVYVKNDGNSSGPLIAGIIVVVVVLIVLWWLLFANNGGGSPSPTGGTDNNPLPTVQLPEGS